MCSRCSHFFLFIALRAFFFLSLSRPVSFFFSYKFYFSAGTAGTAGTWRNDAIGAGTFFLLREHGREQKNSSLRLCDNSSLARCIICFDLVEMFLDWLAASKRQNNGNLMVSIDKSCERFKITGTLENILKNTVDYFDAILSKEEK